MTDLGRFFCFCSLPLSGADGQLTGQQVDPLFHAFKAHPFFLEGCDHSYLRLKAAAIVLDFQDHVRVGVDEPHTDVVGMGMLVCIV